MTSRARKLEDFAEIVIGAMSESDRASFVQDPDGWADGIVSNYVVDPDADSDSGRWMDHDEWPTVRDSMLGVLLYKTRGGSMVSGLRLRQMYGELVADGDLVWATEADSEDDDGARAVARAIVLCDWCGTEEVKQDNLCADCLHEAYLDEMDKVLG
jgi:hypothetical protein